MSSFVYLFVGNINQSVDVLQKTSHLFEPFPAVMAYDTAFLVCNRCLTSRYKDTIWRDFFVNMRLTSTSRSQFTEILQLDYEFIEEDKKNTTPIRIRKLTPIQMPHIDMDDLKNGRKAFTKDEWIDVYSNEP